MDDLGYVLGMGETSCGVETLFEGCESSRGFLSLVTGDVLAAMAEVRVAVSIHL